jgi:hypothetical protein
MEKKLLEPALKAKVNRAAAAAGFELQTMQWEERPSLAASHLTVSVLVHPPTGSYFLFDFRAHHHYAYFLPDQSGRGQQEEVRAETWGRQFTLVKHWLGCVQQAATDNGVRDSGELPIGTTVLDSHDHAS